MIWNVHFTVPIMKADTLAEIPNCDSANFGRKVANPVNSKAKEMVSLLLH